MGNVSNAELIREMVIRSSWSTGYNDGIALVVAILTGLRRGQIYHAKLQATTLVIACDKREHAEKVAAFLADVYEEPTVYEDDSFKWHDGESIYEARASIARPRIAVPA